MVINPPFSSSRFTLILLRYRRGVYWKKIYQDLLWVGDAYGTFMHLAFLYTHDWRVMYLLQEREGGLIFVFEEIVSHLFTEASLPREQDWIGLDWIRSES